jgi:hypothetical protein
MIYDDECGAVSGMIGRGNRNTRRKPSPVSLCRPQIPRDLTWALTQTAAVGSQRLTGHAVPYGEGFPLGNYLRGAANGSLSVPDIDYSLVLVDWIQYLGSSATSS